MRSLTYFVLLCAIVIAQDTEADTLVNEVIYDENQVVEHESYPDTETDADATAPVNFKAFGIPVDIDGNPVISVQYP